MNQQEREEKLQGYVRRLSSGENLEDVRKDFVANFKDVDPAEIMKAEQDLMKSGVDYRDVQRLCDVHSALFHGATQQEKIANAEAAVNASLAREGAAAEKTSVPKDHQTSAAAVDFMKSLGNGDGKAMKENAADKVSLLAMTIGHPVNIFMKEDSAIEKKIKEIRQILNDPEANLDACKDKFEEIRPIGIHYSKKGDLLYPLLKSRYGISGPSDVMWGVDDEIRDEIRALSKDGRDNLTEEDWRSRVDKVLTRAEEMIYKERNILLPICVKTFSDTEWKQMARDIQDYDPCLTDRIPMWREAESAPVWAESPEVQKETGSKTDNNTEKSTENNTENTESNAENNTESRTESNAEKADAALQAALAAAKAAQAAAEAAVRAAGLARTNGQSRKEDEGNTTGYTADAGTAENEKGQASGSSTEGEIVLPTGHFTKEQLRAILNTLPLEISFVDDKDINRYFNEGVKYFKRPLQALDREVYYCHPKKIEGMVRGMISQFREGSRKSFEIWMEKAGHTFLVRYLAIYDDQGKFVGTMECVENMDAAKQHFGGAASPAQKPEW